MVDLTTDSPTVVYGGAQARMIVHCDLDRLLNGDGYGSSAIEHVGPISATTAQRIACDADITLSFETPEGSILDQRPLKRDPSEAQRIEARRRDQGCRFPGCRSKNVTNVHHMQHASKKGRTVMSNLLTLCIRHHVLMHEIGWRVEGDAQNEVRFIGPSGQNFVSLPSPRWRRRRE
jgi:hypothetical protein